MKTSLHRRLILTGLAATAAFTSPLLAQFFTDPNATGAWNTARWNNGADGPTYTANYSQGFPVQFTTGNNYSFAGMGAGLSVGNVTVAPGVTVNFASTGGTYGTGGNIRTIDIGAGALFDLSTNSVSTAAGTGFIKNGAGTWALGGNTYSGGFTLNAGTVIARGINAMGASGVLNINGGAIGANGARNFSGKYSTINVGGDFQLGVLSSAVSIASSTANLTFDSSMALGAATRTITVGANGTYSLNGVIAGAAGTGLNVNRLAGTTGVLSLGGNNTYDGGTVITEAQVNLAHNNALGTGPVTVAGTDGQLRINTVGLTVGNNIIISNTGGSKQISGFGTGASSFTGTVVVNETGAGNFEIQAGAGHTLTLSNTISGSGGAGVKKTGSGTLILGGANSYAGNTQVNSGVLQLNNAAAIPSGSSAGNLEVNGGASFSGTVNLNGNSITINGLGGTAGTVDPVILNNAPATAATLTLGANDASATYGGQINDNSGTGGTVALTKIGTGTQTLTGMSTYSGATLVSAGSLIVNGSLGNTAVTVSSGAKLGGSGTIGGSTVINGSHEPGNSPGLQTFSGGLAYSPTGSLVWELASNTESGRGTNFDAVNVTGGSFSLANGAAMTLSFIGSVDFADPFWTSSREWLVIDLSGTATSADTNAFSIGSVSGLNYSPSLGSFSVDRRPGSNAANSVYLQWTPIPEPGAATLCLAALAGLLRRRARQGRK